MSTPGNTPNAANGLTIIDPEAPTGGERCRSLRCKGQYLNFGLGETEQVAGDGNFWCGKTQRIFGPDDQLVGDRLCREANRGCYETIG